jgi:hypothetical protein
LFIIISETMDKIIINAPAFEVFKSYRDENGQMFIEGIASTTEIDLTNERMSPTAIAKMAARLVGKPLRSEHGKGWDDRIGEIIKAVVINDKFNKPALWIKARLFDWSSKAKDLFHLLFDEQGKMGLSVAGVVPTRGIVKELVAGIGKFISTYIDVEPTEVSVTDHPANLGTFALAVTKSFEKSIQDEDDLYIKANDAKGANESKPKEYADVPDEKFLDPENFKYPVDESHLLPALRYYNHDGQRTAGGYTAAKWGTMGKKLARLLNSEYGEDYKYNPDTEKVEQTETNKSDNVAEEIEGKGVSQIMDTKSNLVTKELNPEVAAFVKDVAPVKKNIAVDEKPAEEAKVEEVKVEEVKPAEAPVAEAPVEEVKAEEVKVEEAKPAEEVKAEEAKPAEEVKVEEKPAEAVVEEAKVEPEVAKAEVKKGSSSSTDTSTGTGSSSGSSTSTGSDSIASLLSDIKSTLDSLKGSSGSSSSDSDSSDSGSSSDTTTTDTSTPSSTSTDTSTTSTDTSTDKSGSSPSYSDNSSTSTDSGSTSTSGGGDEFAMAMADLQKAMERCLKCMKGYDKANPDSANDLEATVKDLKVQVDALKKSKDEKPAVRKGFAINKTFNGEEKEEEVKKAESLKDQIEKDADVSFHEIHAYHNFGILPRKFRDMKK